MTIIEPHGILDIPPEIAVCPICQSMIYVEINEYEQLNDSSWCASECGIHANCVTEPDIDSDEWQGWMNTHWSMPYVDWLPIDVKIYNWLKQNFRFKIES